MARKFSPSRHLAAGAIALSRAANLKRIAKALISETAWVSKTEQDLLMRAADVIHRLEQVSREEAKREINEEKQRATAERQQQIAYARKHFQEDGSDAAGAERLREWLEEYTKSKDTRARGLRYSSLPGRYLDAWKEGIGDDLLAIAGQIFQELDDEGGADVYEHWRRSKSAKAKIMERIAISRQRDSE